MIRYVIGFNCGVLFSQALLIWALCTDWRRHNG